MEGSILRDLLYDEEVILIPECCSEIGCAAFLNNLYVEEIYTTPFLRTIGPAAFSGCMYLNKLFLSDGSTKIGEDAFYLTGIQHVDLPDTLKELGRGCFQDTNLTAVRISGGVHVIPEEAFADNSSLETVWLHEGIQQIKPGAFKNCGALKEVYCPSSLIDIAADAFEGCHVMCVVAPGEWLIYRQDLVDKILYKFK